METSNIQSIRYIIASIKSASCIHVQCDAARPPRNLQFFRDGEWNWAKALTKPSQSRNPCQTNTHCRIDNELLFGLSLVALESLSPGRVGRLIFTAGATLAAGLALLIAAAWGIHTASKAL
eukprot:scaffold8326_cov15-Prasinocladus_malaysianus.AAC.1